MILNNSIAWLVDPQFQYNNPSSRIDNYFEEILRKFKDVLFANKYTFCLGDLTEFPVLDMAGLIAIISLLKKYKELGGQFYSIIGNHDVYNYNLSTVNKTTLGLLSKLKLVTLVDKTGEVIDSVPEVQIEGYTIQCTTLRNPREKLELAKTDKSILVGHCYYAYERDQKHSLQYEDLKELGYKYCFFGHDHRQYPTKIIEKTILYRSGNLSRGKAEAYNFDRKMFYYRLNLDTDKIETVDIDYKPASEVFSIQANEKHNDITPKYIYDMEELMKSFKTKRTMNISIRKKLEENKAIPDNIVEFIKSCYEAVGIEFV